MTTETEIAGLTQATTDLLAAVNVGKASLDAAVSSADEDADRAEAALSQAQGVKTQTETARDEAVAGLGAADQSLNLVHLAYGLAGALDLAGQALKEAERNTSLRIQSGEVTVTQAASNGHTRTYATASVALPKAYRNSDYQITWEVIDAAPFLGCEGQVQIQSRATNGFVLAITGSATSATVRWKAFHPNAK